MIIDDNRQASLLPRKSFLKPLQFFVNRFNTLKTIVFMWLAAVSTRSTVGLNTPAQNTNVRALFYATVLGKSYKGNSRRSSRTVGRNAPSPLRRLFAVDQRRRNPYCGRSTIALLFPQNRTQFILVRVTPPAPVRSTRAVVFRAA